MQSYHVKELMVPLSEYATVPDSATLSEAVGSLIASRDALDKSRPPHRTVLVIDANNQFVGKLSQHDIMEALEPNYSAMRHSLEQGAIHRLGFDDDFLLRTLEQYHLWEKPLDNLCHKAVGVGVRTFMVTPGPGTFVNQHATMDEAIHRLIVGNKQSLLVTAVEGSREIVGVLRLTDVLDFVHKAMQTCPTE